MADANEGPPQRSGVSPAGWAAISAIAVALIGAIVTLTTTWWQKPAPAGPATSEVAAAVVATPASDPPAVAVPAKAEAAALPDPSGWTGSWAGSFQEPGGPRRRIELRIAEGCAKGKACGTISVPHVPCKGDISVAEVRADGVEFHVDRFEPGSAPACQPGAGEVFRETPEGALAYTATYSGGKGVLTRVD